MVVLQSHTHILNLKQNGKVEFIRIHKKQ